MDDDTLLLVGVGAIAAYVLWKTTIAKPWDTQTGRTALSNAGLKTYPSSLPDDSGATFSVAGDTNFRFAPGDLEKLNPAQQILITLDKIIPGTWLTKAVLT
jgi:hypothetical protein